MKTSATDGVAPTLIVFADAGGALGCWLLVDRDGASQSGEVAAGLPARWSRIVLVVPGEQVALHWLDLADGLTQAQAAAAARLMLADASAESLAQMHVAVGSAERGLTPVALAPSSLMTGWLAAGAAAGVEPELIIPSPLLLAPPEEGFVRRELGDVSDYRGPAAAFTMEPELAATLVEGAPVEAVDQARFEAGLASVLASPALNLRQGAFARRRQFRIERPRVRRIALLTGILALLSLAVQIATILSYSFAADRMEAEADALAAGGAAAPADAGPEFAAVAGILFEAVRATPNAELSRLAYGLDGNLVATVMMDNPATLAALQARIEAAGLSVQPGEQRTAGGRPTTDLTVGPA